ncbi:MAG TPA: phosphoglucosamine mutase [Candidatus Dormibacteraeota bacterium]|nr:phosphoglucosamine mutase [Candidatus Dormibacteraeota bacterium]
MRIFGTDGVRGVANADLTPELAFRVGRAAAVVLAHEVSPERPIVVGRDTRVSGPMLEAALTAGICSAGRDVLGVGILPTPAVALITHSIEAAAGAMISASHNPIEDNGIKLFGGDGFKLSDALEQEIERVIADDGGPRPTGLGVGSVKAALGLQSRYLVHLVEHGRALRGLEVVVDCAFGAAYAVGPEALRRLGATVHAINGEPDGSRINVACGATHLEPLIAEVARRPGSVGVAFDGDADRALFVDEEGRTVNGDQILAMLAAEMQRDGELPGGTVVATVMSNVGLEHALRDLGLRLERAAVGDRYVLERMQAGGHPLGGEQSGHVIDLRRNTTGDGLMTAVSVFSAMVRAGARLADLASHVKTYPQVLVNVKTRRKDLVEHRAVRERIAAVESALGDEGRVLVRPSGTEPLLRVMVEGPDRGAVVRMAEEIAEAIRAAGGEA